VAIFSAVTLQCLAAINHKCEKEFTVKNQKLETLLFYNDILNQRPLKIIILLIKATLHQSLFINFLSSKKIFIIILVKRILFLLKIYLKHLEDFS